MSDLENNSIITRKQFLSLAGGTAGAVAMASMGIPSGWAKNKSKVNTEKIKHTETNTDVLVIGGGMAGLFAAVKAHDSGSKVLLVSKGRLGASGQTPFAKGIFAYDPKNEKMSINKFVENISKSSIGTNNKAYTRQVAEHSLDRVNELKEWGFFDSPLCYNSFNKPLEERKIPVLERIVITHLIKERGRIAGAAGFSLDSDEIHIFKSKSVILCTGAGGFKPNGFPICDLTHDGTIMAYKIGALVTGKEWNDGHPGQSTNAAACFDGWHGMFEQKPSTTSIGIRHDLGVDLNYMAYKKGNPVKMGPPHLMKKNNITGGPYQPSGYGESNRQEGPPGGGRGKHNGPPPGDGEHDGPPGMGGTTVGGSSAGMSIHKSEGIVPINEKCESNIKGLYAAGDALGSYMCGGIYTQIGSSLAGSAVQGAISGEAASEYSKSVKILSIPSSKIKKIEKEILAPLKREAGYSPAWVTQTLQGIMIPNFIIYIKKENLMKAALAYVEELRDHHMTMLKASDMHELRLAHETMNMIVTAEMKLKASLMRKESRCSHYRLDYPKVDYKNWNAWINIYKGRNGNMQFKKQPFGTKPV